MVLPAPRPATPGLCGGDSVALPGNEGLRCALGTDRAGHSPVPLCSQLSATVGHSDPRSRRSAAKTTSCSSSAFQHQQG